MVFTRQLSSELQGIRNNCWTNELHFLLGSYDAYYGPKYLVTSFPHALDTRWVAFRAFLS
jgi:hypothetical protein